MQEESVRPFVQVLKDVPVQHLSAGLTLSIMGQGFNQRSMFNVTASRNYIKNRGEDSPCGQGTFSGSLAEYAIAACMWFAKRLPELWANQCASKWTKLTVEELRCKINLHIIITKIIQKHISYKACVEIFVSRHLTPEGSRCSFTPTAL